MRACRLGGLSRAAWYRKSTAQDQAALRMRIRELALSRPRLGYLRIHVCLIRGMEVTASACTVYRLEGLQVRMRMRRRKRLSLHAVRPLEHALGERWSMDFVHDQLATAGPSAC